MILLVQIIILVLSFYVLAVLTEEFFVPSLDKLSVRLKLSPEAAGATLMAVGSSAPEFFTSFFAVFRTDGMADIGAGTIVGSAIFNILVIVGVSAMFRKALLTWHVALRDISFYIVSIIALMISFMDGQIVLYEAVAFVGLYIAYVSTAVKWRTWFGELEDSGDDEGDDNGLLDNPLSTLIVKALSFSLPHPKKHSEYYLITFTLSIVLIAFLSHMIVESAVQIGEILHISGAIIALTVLAAGTSIPDLLSSIIVAKQGRGDMAISNAVGSNIFDILFGLGFPWLLILLIRGENIIVGTENLKSSIFLLFATVIALLIILLAKKWEIGKSAGFLMVLMYVAYLIYNISLIV